MRKARVYLEVARLKAEYVPACNREHTPPVIQESAWRSISLSVSHYRFSFYVSDSGVLGNGVRHCLPQTLPLCVRLFFQLFVSNPKRHPRTYQRVNLKICAGVLSVCSTRQLRNRQKQASPKNAELQLCIGTQRSS